MSLISRNRRRVTAFVVAALTIALIGGTTVALKHAFFGPRTIIAYFTTATAIYAGDEVRVSGVKVGSIESIVPEGTLAKMTLGIDRHVPIPADAQAVIVAQNLVAARYVQLTPAYRSRGQRMADGAVIPSDRTAVPVEWDEVKTQLTRLATELGPKDVGSGTSVSRFIDSTASALDGNGEKLRQTLAQLSGVGRILANGSGNIVDIVKNLQVFVSALRNSNEQIISFQDRLATLTSVLDGSRTDLDAALDELSTAVGEVQRFVAGTRNQAAEQVQRLGDVTQNLVDNKMNLENVLHVAPNALANGYNIYNPSTGSAIGSFVINNFSNPLQFICTAIGAVENATAPETAKLCAQYLGPALRLLNFNYIPVPLNAFLTPSPRPDELEYSDPKLMPSNGFGQPQPPEPPPAVSAYTGFPDNPSPVPGPQPAPFTGRPPDVPPPGAQQLLPGAPPVVPPNVPQTSDDLLMPSTTPPVPASGEPADTLPPTGALLPAERTTAP